MVQGNLRFAPVVICVSTLALLLMSDVFLGYNHIPAARAQTHSIVSATRVGGGSSFTSPASLTEFGMGYSVTLAFIEGSPYTADDPHNPSNAPPAGASSGGARYRFVIQDNNATHNPVGIPTVGDDVTWSWDSTNRQLTITITNARIFFSAGFNEVGVSFFVLDSFSDPAAFLGTTDLNSIGGTIMTNAETFSLAISERGVWDLTATGRTGTSGYFKIFMTKTMLDALGSVIGVVKVLVNKVPQTISPTSSSGVISKGGVDKPGFLISIPLSYSTKEVRTDMRPTAEALCLEPSEVMTAERYAREMSRTGTNFDAALQRINEGLAAVNARFPETKGEVYHIMGGGGNIMARNGYLTVLYGGKVNKVVQITYYPGGTVSISLGSKPDVVICRAPSGQRSSAVSSGSQPPISVALSETKVRDLLAVALVFGTILGFLAWPNFKRLRKQIRIKRPARGKRR